MLKKLQKHRSEGFTIIEVMIVLAIAALILLIVLLAIPALQRNARNTQIKDDVGNVAGAISTYESDNDGTPPTQLCGTGSISIGTGTGACPGGLTNPETFKVNGATKVSVVASVASSWATTGEIQVVVAKTCIGATASRAFAVYYNIETSGSTSQKCVDA